MAAIKAAGRLVDAAVLVHSYPYCWRSDTPLIYRAVPSWFVAVSGVRAGRRTCGVFLSHALPCA